ncbi:MAG: radical SAM protein [Gemmatimonadaceae bacterium]
MRILLVRPAVPRHTIGLKHIMICEPLELEYVAAGLQGHEVEVLDLIVEKGLRHRLHRFRPDVVGTSSYISGVNEVIKVCRETKRWNSACLTVVGGVQAARVPEDFLDNSVDLIVRGDGATTMPAIVRALQEGGDLRTIPGVAIPKDGQTLYHSPTAPYMPKADELPLPDRSVVRHLKQRYYYLMHRPVATMKTTWGCWYDCNFCYTWRITQGTPYSRSPESIVEELKRIEAKEIYIVDDIFLINPRRLEKLAGLLRQEKIHKNYLVYARADFISTNEPIIAEWAELGLKAVFVGLEAVTNRELDGMNKRCTVDHNLEAIRVLQRHGVDVYGSLIPQPDYSVEDWRRLRAFIRDSGLYYLNISPLVPLPGTSEHVVYQDRLIVPREAHGLWDLSHAVVETRLPLKEHYRQLLITYASVIFNLRRARRVTHRTLPSIWSWNYARLLVGAAKIGLQFISAHRHHSPRQLRVAMDRGPAIDLPYAFERMHVQPSAAELLH